MYVLKLKHKPKSANVRNEDHKRFSIRTQTEIRTKYFIIVTETKIVVLMCKMCILLSPDVSKSQNK